MDIEPRNIDQNEDAIGKEDTRKSNRHIQIYSSSQKDISCIEKKKDNHGKDV